MTGSVPPRQRSGPASFFAPRNIVTYLAVGAALLAVVAAGNGSRHGAGAWLAVAALADLLDGRFARLFPAASDERRFGVQIDSLADAVTFGLAPVACLDRLGGRGVGAPLGAVFLLGALFYVLSALTRLAYYNVSQDGEEAAPGFVGLPTTLAGMAWSALLLAPVGAWCAAPLALLGVAMVAPLGLPRPGMRAVVALVVACLVLVLLHLR